MSGIALKWAWMQELPISQKIVLIALAWHADDDGIAWPKLTTLVNELPMSRRGTIIQIRKLEFSGYLVKELAFRDTGAQTTNRYILDLEGVHHTCMGGMQHDLHGGDAATVHGGDADHAAPLNIQYKIQDKIHVTGDESQETQMHYEEVLNEYEVLDRDYIFSNALRKDDKLTPDGCAYLWRNCRASAAKGNGFQIEILKKEKKMLHSAYKRVGEDFNLAVWAVMANWIGFTKHAADISGAFSLPQQPTISFFIKFIEAAVDFKSTNAEASESGFMQLTAKTPETLTNVKENKDNGHTAITSDELAAISRDF